MNCTICNNGANKNCLMYNHEKRVSTGGDKNRRVLIDGEWHYQGSFVLTKQGPVCLYFVEVSND